MRPPTLLRALVAVAAAVGLLSATMVLAGADTAPPSTAVAGATTGPEAEQGRPVPATDTSARSTAVVGLLDRWAATVRAGDADALTPLLDPAADPAFAAAERARTTNLAGLALADWGYEITGELEPVVDPGLLAASGADELWAPPVVLRYALAGGDDTATRRPVGLVVARRGETWRLLSDTAVADRGRTTWRGPWDFAPVVSRVSPQGVVLGHPGQEAELDVLLAELATAVPAVTQVWGPAWSQRAVVVLPGSQAELSALVGPGFDGAGVAAVTTADAVDLAASTATGVRVVFNPTSLPRLTAETLPIVLRHELTHVAARTVTADQAPLWMLEGFADHVGYRGSGIELARGAPAVAALVAANGPPDSLPSDADFRSATGSEVAYQLCWTFAEFVADTRGEGVLLAAYRAVAALPGPTAAELDRALVAATGSDLAGLVAGWRTWLPTQL